MYQTLSNLLIAISLSMDAFSLAIILGTVGLKKNMILKISIVVGIFHFFMPLIGDMVGETLLRIIPIESRTIVGTLFLIIAIQMFISIFKEDKEIIITGIFAILLFAFTVSLDSFSIGISLTIISTNHFLSASTFMITSFIFTIIGLILGKRIEKHFGNYATIIGSIILLICALKYIF